METTLILVKPDGVQRGLVGNVIDRFERKGLQVVGLKMLRAPRDLLERHYEVHRERPFFASLLEFMSSGPVVALALRGEGAISIARNLIGATDGAQAAAGTIRGDHAMSKSFNIVHGSDAPETAAIELELWFSEGVLDYALGALRWVYDPSDA
jgi:nucleoside-diphosphate kinase